jgi:hypothetical protein
MNLSHKIKKLIQRGGMAKTLELFGGLEHLKNFLLNDPELSDILNNLNGKVYYSFLGNNYEFDFEIIGYKLNRWETQGTALINVIYDHKKLSPIQNEKLKTFIVIQNDKVEFSFELNPATSSYFPRTSLVDVKKINGENFDNQEIIIRGYKFYESELQGILHKIHPKNNKDVVNENNNSRLKNYLLNIIETQGLIVASKYVDGIENLSNIFNIPSTEMITDYFQERKLDIRNFNINTGGYEFIFKLLYVQNNDNYLLFFYEIVEGTVTLMMTDETLDLKSKKLKDFEFAWEIHQEINDLLNEFTYNLMRNLKLTGFDDVLIDYTI